MECKSETVLPQRREATKEHKIYFDKTCRVLVLIFNVMQLFIRQPTPTDWKFL